MIKTLSKHGNSLALVIDKPILELLNISAETPLEVKTDGDALIVSPVRDDDRSRRLQESLKDSVERYGNMLKRLAE